MIKLNPCTDEDGIIRCDGRLKFADFLPYDTRFPIILPRGHWVTKLIVKNYHERGNHAAGVNFTLCQFSERFGSSPHVRRFASGIVNVMNVREDEVSQPVKSWRHFRKQGFVSPSNPSLKQP